MKILILGDGNFSFSLALANHLFNANDDLDVKSQNPGYRYLDLDSCTDVSMHTTSFDSHQELLAKYPESESILNRLSKYPRVSIEHCVNAWELERHFEHSFDIIIWNHPHLHREDFRLHRFLLAHFLNSATKRLNPESKLCISLVDGQETRWQLVEQAHRFNLELSQMMPLLESDFPGYICKRNNTGKSFKNEKTLKQHCNSSMNSFVYQFKYRDAAFATPLPAIDTLNLSERLKISNDEAHQIAKAELKTIVQWNPLDDKKQKTQAKEQKHNRKQDGPSSHVEKRSVLYQCPDCTKTVPTMRGIRQHHHMIHVLKLMPSPTELTESIVCELCDGRKFARDIDFKTHCIQKHSTLTTEDQKILGINESDANCSESRNDYKYYPCDVCGQSVMDSGDSNDGMLVHLESLKPLIGQIMRCPLSACISVKKSFLEHRALEQHYRMCRYGRSEHLDPAVGK